MVAQALNYHWHPDLTTTVSTCLSRPYNRISADCGYCVQMDIIATLTFTICMVSFLCFSCYHYKPHLPSCWPNIDVFLEKIIKAGENHPLPLCQSSCTKLIDH